MAGLFGLALFLLAGCGSPETTPAETPDQAAPPEAAIPVPADSAAEPSMPDTLGAWRIGDLDVSPTVSVAARLVDVRTATHEATGAEEGYDRIVFEFAQDWLPGYHLEYIDRPVRACGSGQVVPLTGDGTLQIRLTPAQAHTDAGDATVTDRERTLDLPVVNALKVTCNFEGDLTWVAAVESPNPYRVTELRAPTRLVVDIQH